MSAGDQRPGGVGAEQVVASEFVGVGGERRVLDDLDLASASAARMYDFFLDGKDNYRVDRMAAEGVLARFPHARTAARANRAFMRRAVRFLAGRAGVRQFLDIGTGLPFSPNVHEVAQRIAPECRVLYVDHDPVVVAHARALLISDPRGWAGYLRADLRDPEGIVASPEVGEVLDLSEPVALTLMALLHFVPDAWDPYTLVGRLVEALPCGSYLALTHGTADFAPQAVREGADEYRKAGIAVQPRTQGEVARFLTGLELVPPGVVAVTRWQPDEASHLLDALEPAPCDAQVSLYGAVGRKTDAQ